MKSLLINIKIGIVFIAMLVTALTLFSFVHKADANPLSFGRSQSAPATTTVNYYQVAGTATTTVYLDAGQNLPAFDSAVLATQFVASSTLSTLAWRYEYANDTSNVNCTVTPTACDWYSDTLIDRTNASTTLNINVPSTYSWTYSSSTDMCSTTDVISTNNRGCKLIKVPTPTRYARVLFYRQPGVTTNGAVWAEFITQKQR